MATTWRAATALTAGLVVLAPLAIRVAAQQPASTTLARLQFDVIGVRLVVDPPALTVPKNIATQINTSLVTPDGLGGEVRFAIASLTDGAAIEAVLRGPSISPTLIRVAPGESIPIPPLALAGDYFLDGVRLVKDGQTVLDATSADGHPASTIPIRVINEVLVASVTSQPLSLDDIRSKGIVIDEHNFSAVNFQVAFNIDGAPFTISAPAVLPTAELLQTHPDRTQLIQQLSALNRSLAATQTSLPPQFDRPGLNFSIAALPFFPSPDNDASDRGFDTPPVTGLIVIPGNVAFLHQFFSALLLVANVAPDGTPLTLQNVSSTITLPTGLDRVAGTYDQPGDDPLRLARIDGVGIRPTVPIVQRGPDGQLGTADDVPVIPPQKQGEGEFLIEGLQEGSQFFDIAIKATLVGLPSGPVNLEGQANGAVFVRNPTFSVTLAHPRTVRAGEPYDLYATVTNTSLSPANLVSVNLDPRSISGAQLLSESSVTFDAIAPGQSAVAKYSLRAQLTGEVTFTSFTGDAALGGGIRLVTGVDERGAPLSANAIVLPATTDFLPGALVDAAQRVLGQAFSIATAPAEALPSQVLFVKRQTVIDRGVELAEAGERVKFGEPLTRVIDDLLLDWLGNSALDPGFDQILRATDAGAAFLQQVAAIVGPDAAGGLAIGYQRQFAQATVSRPAHLSAIAAGPPGSPAPTLTIARASGGATQGGERGGSSLPSGAALGLTDGSSATAFDIVASAAPDRYSIELVAPVAGSYDLGIVIPGPEAGRLQQLVFAGVALDNGGAERIDVDLTTPGSPTLSIDRDGDGTPDRTLAPTLVDLDQQPPQLLAARQLESSSRDAAGGLRDPATYGLLVGALFDGPITRASAELQTNYQIASNAVIGAALQHSGRLVYLYLQKPVGGLTPRSLSVTGIVGAQGDLTGAATMPIAMVLTDGAHVFGQVRDAGGSGVGGGVLKLTAFGNGESFDVAAFRTDSQGGFDLDFMPRVGDGFTLTAQHPVTRDLATIAARVQASGQQLLLNPTFLGRGTVRGRLIAPGGATVGNTPIALIPGSVLGVRGFQTSTNALGEFTFTDVPVGVFTLTAADAAGSFGQATGVLARAGDLLSQDLVLVAQPLAAGRLVGRVFLSDGATPATGFTVYAGRYKRDAATIAAVDQTTTDATGSFAFARSLPPDTYDVVAVDPATGQLGASQAAVVAQTTTSVSIVLESTGSVEGVVFNGRGEAVAGALVAGGTVLGTTNANGFFHIDGVPAGNHTVEAGDPATRRRGSVQVTVLPGHTASASITLESRATIVGRVLDAAGNPVPGASVRLPAIDGFTFVIANNRGVFTFPDLTLGDYLLQAPGPSKESLISFMEANGIDPRTAFTSGDAPDGLTDPTIPPSASDANQALAAYQRAVQTFFSVDESLLTGLPMAALGGFGWNKVQLFQDATTVTADVQFLSQGAVSGRTVDSAARPTGAAVRVSSLNVSTTGFPGFGELSRVNTDPATGTFSFNGIARFDLSTFQAAGVRAGDFTLEAASPFSPVHPQVRGQLSVTTQNLANLVLQFPAASETNATVSGQVVMPDGVTPAPAGTQVAISFGTLTVTTDSQGRFVSQLPIPAGTYTVTAQAINGLRGQSVALAPPGGNVDVRVRLLGLGAVTVTVKRPSGAVVANAHVTLVRASFPGDVAEGDTDAAGIVRFVNLTEGPFGVTAEEAGTGLAGRASGSILRDSEVNAAVGITASGRITGTFVSATGAAPIPFAQVALSSGSLLAYASTDAAGRFELAAIPVGGFSVEGFDPLTGRRGRVISTLLSEGQTVDVTILEAPRGTVRGIVVNADGVTPMPASRVSLTSSSFVATTLQATALTDGSFRFDGVPAGTFALEATDPVSAFSGSATGTVTFEGQIVDANVHLAPFGALHVTVLDVNGQPAANASVTLDGGHASAVDQTGQLTIEHLPLGTHHLLARSLADGNNGGEIDATIAAPNQTIDATVRLRDVGSVTVTVVPASGVGAVPSALVTLNAQASAGTALPSRLATVVTGFTDASGAVTFASVPIGNFFVKGEAAALAGVATGAVGAPASNIAVQVQLGPSGTVAGRLLLPDGITPAAAAFATLRFQSQSSLRSGVLQVTTGLAGTFELGGIPTGSFSLSAFEVISGGVQSAGGAVTADGQRIDLGDLILDNAGPAILQVSPPDRSRGADARGPIVITFSEPIDPASITVGGNVTLLEGGALVPLTAATFSADNLTLTVRPTRDLASGALETITVKGAPDGPKDRAGLPLHDASVSTFTVRDSIAPTVVSVNPAAGARQIAPDAVVRVTFSEPVVGAAIALRDDAGAPVGGGTSLAVGGTVAIFTPTAFLRPNTAYTATVSNVADTSGNPLVGGVFAATFSTVDTIAPVITALQLGGTPRAGSAITIQPTMTATDVQRVEYSLGTTPAGVVTQVPFAGSITLPIDGSSALVTAVAFDLVGNRSAPFSLPVTIQPNAPPTVTLTNLGGSTTVGQGQHVDFRVAATDDDRLAQIFFTAVGAATASAVQTVPPGQTAFTQTFTLVVPADAPSNTTITVQAAATDAAGGQSQPAVISLSVLDAARPTVAIGSPVNNAVVAGGQTVQVVVDAADDVALASVAVTCNPALAGCESRAISPAAPSAHQTFDLTIPASLQAPQTISLSIAATDTSGNVGLGGRVLRLADTARPSIAALESASGSTHVVPGDTAILRATVSDNVGVTALTFTTEGALITSGTSPVAPAVVNGIATLSIPIPASLSSGASITVRLRARDAANNLSDEAVLVLATGDSSPPLLTVLEPADGVSVAPGGSVTVRAHATDDVAVGRLTLSVSGAFSAADARDVTPATTPADATFVVTVPAGTPAGSATLRVQAIDTSGSPSAPVDRIITIPDVIAPQVQILSPLPGARLDPRQPIPVTVSATDAVGVTAISFTATGTVAASETRLIAPAATSRSETFTVNVTPLPATDGSLTFTASARDAAGNVGSATTVAVQLDDVVAPDVLSTTPANGATGVDPLTPVVVRFSEAMNRATLSGASLELRRGSTVVPTSIAINANDDVATLTPLAPPLAANATFTLVVSTGASDRAGHALIAARTFTFTTASPDTVSPKVASIDPPDNSADVSLVRPVIVTFTEPVDPASVTTQTFRVRVGSTPVAGTLSVLDGNGTVRFTPAEPLPAAATVVIELTGAITDAIGNPLVANDGSPLVAPLTFTFATGRFSLTSPAGDDVVENSALLLEARASAALGATRVVFTVNGQALPAVSGPPFTTTFAVGSAASTATLTIVASARDGGGVEIARDQRTFNVVVGLTVTPALGGVPLGGAGSLRFSVSSALSNDLPIALTAGDPALVTFPVNPVVIPAGQTAVDAAIAGAATGATAVIGSSTHGQAVAIVAVSPVQAGQTLTPSASPAGLALSNPPTAGTIITPAASLQTVGIAILDAPAAADTPVLVFSTNSAVATATATSVAAGQQTTNVTITAVADGVATIVMRVGNQVRAFTVFVGAPPAGSVPLLLATPVGVAISNPPSAAQVIAVAGRHLVLTIQLLNTPATVDTPVVVSTSNAAVASASASTIRGGETTTTLTIDTIGDGAATFTLRAGNETRSVTIFVGAPPAGSTPILIARPVGVSVVGLATLGRTFAPLGVARTLSVRLFDSPVLTDTAVTVATSDASIATASAGVVRAGEQSVNLDITTGSGGTATLTIEAAGVRRELTLVVGSDPAPGTTPPIVAAPVGVTVIPNPRIGRAFGQPGVATAATIGIPLLDTPAGGPVAVTISTGNTSVVTLGGGSTITMNIDAGDRVLQLPIAISGTEGAALLTIELQGLRRELLIIVGNPPASEIPAVTAPVVGIRIG